MSGLHDPYWYLRDEFDDHTAPGDVKVPFWLNPPRVYTGVAWYQRTVTIPEGWRGRRASVYLERVHWGGSVWFDGNLIGALDTLGAPQVYDIGMVEPGEHILTVRVDNNLLVNVRRDGHAVTDSTQTNWNGLVGRLQLVATTPVYIARARVFPDIADRSARVEVTVRNAGGQSGQGTLRAGSAGVPVEWSGEGDCLTNLVVTLPADTPLWDEFHPALQRLTLTLEGDSAADAMALDIGLRRIEARDARFLLNGESVFFRGANEGCQFPLTGYTPTDVDSWRGRPRPSSTPSATTPPLSSCLPATRGAGPTRDRLASGLPGGPSGIRAACSPAPPDAPPSGPRTPTSATATPSSLASAGAGKGASSAGPPAGMAAISTGPSVTRSSP